MSNKIPELATREELVRLQVIGIVKIQGEILSEWECWRPVDGHPLRWFTLKNTNRLDFNHLVTRALWENGKWTALPVDGDIVLTRYWKYGFPRDSEPRIQYYTRGIISVELSNAIRFPDPLSALETVMNNDRHRKAGI